MTKKIIAGSLLLVGLLSTTASAKDMNTSFLSDVETSVTAFVGNSEIEVGNVSNDDTSFGVGVEIMKPLNYHGLKAGGEFAISSEGEDTMSYAFLGKLTKDITPKVNLGLVAGYKMFEGDYNPDAEANGLTYGVEASYKIENNISVRVSYLTGDYDYEVDGMADVDSDISTVNIGIKYTF